MRIQSLCLKQYRNFSSLDLSFASKKNIFIGDNAQGKTNILESIYYLAITKSFLNIKDKNIININSNYSRIKAVVEENNSEKELEIYISESQKKLFIDKNEIKKHRDYIGNINVILFTPDTVRLFREGPSYRRKYLNIQISQIYNKYIMILNNFNLLLKQRNEYLKIVKDNKINNEYLDIINTKYIELSEEIYKYRIKYLEYINSYLDEIYFNLFGVHGLKISYFPNFEITGNNYKNSLKEKLLKNISREIFLGQTLFGPHRDDFVFILDNKQLNLFGSQGQIKLAILAFKLSEVYTFKNITKQNPILLLDDIFSELDIKKRNNLLNYLNEDIQIFMTTTDLNNINELNVIDSNIFTVNNNDVNIKEKF